jgi:transcriptional regulator GlxA family with amidase domain
LVQRVEEHIQSAYHRPLTLAAMARAAGVSVSTLTHRYRLETGRTPIGRLMEHRLDVARGMLLKGASIKAVAAHTGFYDEFHLSKAFKRRFGLPPRRYARRRAAASAAPRG